LIGWEQRIQNYYFMSSDGMINLNSMTLVGCWCSV